MVKRKRVLTMCVGIISLLAAVIGLAIFARQVSAGTHMGDRLSRQTLEQGEIIEGPGWFTGDVITIDGEVQGTTFAAGEQIIINGRIDGALFAAGQRVLINGEVTGNIYWAGEIVRFEGNAEREVFLAGETVVIEEGAMVGRDGYAAGMNVRINGEVERHLMGAGESVILNGAVSGDADLRADSLTLNDTSEIGGDFRYESPNEASISSNAVIAGETVWTESEVWQRGPQLTRQNRLLIRGMFLIWSLLSSLIVWLVIRLVSPLFWQERIRPVESQVLKTVGAGTLVLFGIPLLSLLLMVTVIGITMGVILLITYGLALYLARIITAVLIGNIIIRRVGQVTFWTELLQMLIGLLIFEILSLIPVVNILTGIVVVVIGLGAMTLSKRRTKRQTDEYPEY
ncbi:polymer-forming cytoskeletal protein [Alkalibacterium pelagium]|uniref:DUF8173 domain-containing protein n=1 Tax=Alkalibacterium pelagium TaxID=426702 RepID=A0A1H7F0Q5_9LACT|nr:polymer-forming cytoskeletal protein [Alkalibacterium pelagium]GEN49529.1 hypothetical protein APE02nite_01940 [Alkalibacterium pelagium]SEK19598.1 hypothetical protein SAMN04488099_101142 [Alkalibacterium pelagium]